MIATADLEEYRAGIREQVCLCCVERPAGGPPCAPLGKICGIELNLRQLVDVVHSVRSGAMDQYMARFREEVCARCRYQGTKDCPCPLEYLLLLAVQAIEDIDEQRNDLIRAVDA